VPVLSSWLLEYIAVTDYIVGAKLPDQGCKPPDLLFRDAFLNPNKGLHRFSS
jgi:hypothetical protein